MGRKSLLEASPTWLNGVIATRNGGGTGTAPMMVSTGQPDARSFLDEERPGIVTGLNWSDGDVAPTTRSPEAFSLEETPGLRARPQPASERWLSW